MQFSYRVEEVVNFLFSQEGNNREMREAVFGEREEQGRKEIGSKELGSTYRLASIESFFRLICNFSLTCAEVHVT